MIDRNEFFREATLRVCGSLEIEQAMVSCLEYIGLHIPADSLYLQLFAEDLNSLRTVATARKGEAKLVDMITPLSERAWKDIHSRLSQGIPSVVIFEPAEDSATIREMMEFHQVESESVAILFLESEGTILGTLGIVSEGSGVHTEDDAALIEMLKEPFLISLSNTLKHREVGRLRDLLADDNRYLQDELHRIRGDEIIGADFGLKHVMELVGQVAPLSSPVLLLGETGSGKEVIANAIHTRSVRRNGPFIKVNCGAIPESLLDSELFGHEKGAFTGALNRKRGRFERADTGTIFLDEIGELPAEAQVRLLRVLQEKEIERVGGSEPVDVDIRVIAATHRDLPGMVASGEFREDLYFRLKVFPISIPPLRKRKGDIPALLQYMIGKKTREMQIGSIPTLAPGVIERLMEYPWPGNVRELENAVERELILSPNKPLAFPDTGNEPVAAAMQSPEEGGRPESLNIVESRHFRRVLDYSNGRIEGKDGAAEILGLNPGTLRHRLRKRGISFGRKKKNK